ncbi:MAG: hypothetical protein SF182_06835 [Deltaproteobacteria bacterium]|nr:hypothetical protein [Deltaproteobacteria bacterium]
MRLAADQLRDAVSGAVDDPTRQAQALQLVDDIDHQLRNLARANQALEIQASQLFGDYDAGTRDFEDLLKSAQSGRDHARKRLIDARVALAALLTASEWQAVAEADADALAAWTGRR